MEALLGRYASQPDHARLGRRRDALAGCRRAALDHDGIDVEMFAQTIALRVRLGDDQISPAKPPAIGNALARRWTKRQGRIAVAVAAHAEYERPPVKSAKCGDDA